MPFFLADVSHISQRVRPSSGPAWRTPSWCSWPGPSGSRTRSSCNRQSAGKIFYEVIISVLIQVRDSLTENPGHVNLICVGGADPTTSKTMSRPATTRLSLPFFLTYILGTEVLLLEANLHFTCFWNVTMIGYRKELGLHLGLEASVDLGIPCSH